MSFAIGNAEADVASLLSTAQDDDQLTMKEAHRRFGKGFKRGGVAVASGLERGLALYLECQSVGSIGYERARAVSQAHGDESQVPAVGIER